jgi:pilus assembly protein Flp/PilA
MQWLEHRLAVLRAMGQKGAAAVEYGLLVALIAVAIIAAISVLGGKVNTVFTCAGNALPTGLSASAQATC